MDVKHINPFLDSVINVMPQLGITDIRKGKLKVKGKVIESPGVLVNVGIVGELRGNVIYGITMDCAKAIASTMMMGMPVNELDEMAQSAISELTNMLTANACMGFSEQNINIDISTPTLMYGDFTATASSDKVLCVELKINDLPFEINIAIDRVL